jgi:steroid delta-isomerase-like uncharacterized protein
MKNILQALVLVPVMAGVTVVHAAVPPKQVVESYMKAWNEHNANKAASHLANDAVFYDAAVGTPQNGQVAARDNVISVFINAVPDLKWEMTSKPIESKDGISFQWKFTGNNTGAWGKDTPATNKPINFEGVSFVRVKNDKIVYQGDYYDSATLNKQLGW